MDVVIDIKVDQKGYEYKLICEYQGKIIEKGESILNDFDTINSKHLLALNTALSRMSKESDITIKMAEGVVYGAISNGWVVKWAVDGWVTAKNKPVANKELWQQYLRLSVKHNIELQKKEN